MEARNQLKRHLSRPEGLQTVRRLLAESEVRHRTELAERVCEHFGFFDARGRPQQASCLKALRELASDGHFRLPAPQTTGGPGTPCRLEHEVEVPQNVPACASKVRGLELRLVTSRSLRRVWNEMMITEHPQGAGPLVGHQLRYLVASVHGWLGGFGFASAALQLADRDEWIGWDLETRRSHLHRVIMLSRFLIRPSVQCRNLASMLLGRCLRRLPHDVGTTYGFRPWLVETFVDTTRVSGTCFRAANWIRVGRTKGRGRQDQDRRCGKARKDIYLYPLEDDFRTKLGVPPGAGRGPLTIDQGIDSDNWAEHEFAGAPLGDKRRTDRLITSTTVMADAPQEPITTAADGDWALVKGHYRLIDHPDDWAVNMEAILRPHRKRTIRRMKVHETALCIQDSTTLDYTNLETCEGLGVTGSNQTGARSKGLRLHTTFVSSPQGLPLGILRGHCFAPQRRPDDDDRKSEEIPIEEKETFKWFRGLRDCQAVAEQMPDTRVLCVMDRGADIFELFEEWQSNPSVDLLVRAQHNRRTGGELKLFETVKSRDPRSEVQLIINRKSARPKRTKQKPQAKRQEREAHIVLRTARAEIQPPVTHPQKAPISLWILHAVEKDPPDGVEPIEWFLLTSLALETPDTAEQCLRWYCFRWRIEEWHRVLKTGCRVQELGHETAERIKRALAMYMVIAWRVMLMTLLGRETPDLPPEVLFSDIELEVLGAWAKNKGWSVPETLGDVVKLVGRMGGHLGRSRDPPAGHKLMWQGYVQLRHMGMGAEAMRDA